MDYQTYLRDVIGCAEFYAQADNGGVTTPLITDLLEDAANVGGWTRQDSVANLRGDQSQIARATIVRLFYVREGEQEHQRVFF